MGFQGRLAAAKQEMLASLSQLPPRTSFQIIAYNRSAEPLRLNGGSGLAAITATSLREATEALAALHAEGDTDHLPALRRALAQRPDTILWLTDGADLTSEQIRAITRLNGGTSVIHAIEVRALATVGPADALQSLAAANGGTYRAVSIR
jgi:hypothetical protein